MAQNAVNAGERIHPKAGRDRLPGGKRPADEPHNHALPAGTRILSARGEVPVEALNPGDRIITRDRGMARIRAVRRQVSPNGTVMVRIPAGALGYGRPERDVTLPGNQAVALRDWRARMIFGAPEARVASDRLVDGQVIRHVKTRECALHSLMLDTPALIYADGLELLSGGVEGLEEA